MNRFIKKIFINEFYPLYLKNELYLPNKTFSSDKLNIPNKTFSSMELLDALQDTDGSLGMGPVYQEVYNTVKNRIEKNPRSICLIGIGSGSITDYFRSKFNTTKIVEMDLNHDAVKRLKSIHKNDKLRHSLYGDICSLPTAMKNKSFDAVIIYGVLRYINNLEMALKNSYDLLSPGGILYLGEGRKQKLIKKCQKIFKTMEIKVKFSASKEIPLINITFAYYLIYKSKSDSDLFKLIKSYSEKNHVSLCKMAFKLADTTKGKIYSLTICKNN